MSFESSPVTDVSAFAEPGGHRRTREDTKAVRSGRGGHARKRRDSRGHEMRPVRDREAPVSNPGPPTRVWTQNSASATRVMAILGLGVTGVSQD
jgi:hypothetical protein